MFTNINFNAKYTRWEKSHLDNWIHFCGCFVSISSPLNFTGKSYSIDYESRLLKRNEIMELKVVSQSLPGHCWRLSIQIVALVHKRPQFTFSACSVLPELFFLFKLRVLELLPQKLLTNYCSSNGRLGKKLERRLQTCGHWLNCKIYKYSYAHRSTVLVK